MTQTLHVVMGTTGEYSDRSEWPVKAFVDEAKAQRFVLEVDEWIRVNGLAMSDSPNANPHPDAAARGMVNPFDPNMSFDYTGTDYYIMSVALDDDVRQDIAATVVEDVEAGRLPKRALALDGKLT